MAGDGRAVSGSEDETVRVWDLGAGRLLHTLEGHTGGVGAVAVCGIAANICCFYAARDLRAAGLRVLLVEDASAGIDVVYAVPGMILATTFVSLPLVLREVVPVLEEVGTDTEQAARTLGAGPWTTFRSLTWTMGAGAAQ